MRQRLHALKTRFTCASNENKLKNFKADVSSSNLLTSLMTFIKSTRLQLVDAIISDCRFLYMAFITDVNLGNVGFQCKKRFLSVFSVRDFLKFSEATLCFCCSSPL